MRGALSGQLVPRLNTGKRRTPSISRTCCTLSGPLHDIACGPVPQALELLADPDRYRFGIVQGP
ncbi:MAG TPA: hypothetical protein VEH31_16720, partial [Streptosporangiaceae bacterium]|nr:hypothetical protein [Streptosporangiaceae bacterium]